jgi:hypothetical protein
MDIGCLFRKVEDFCGAVRGFWVLGCFSDGGWDFGFERDGCLVFWSECGGIYSIEEK